MKVVVADTSPLNYLVLIDCVDVLRALYGHILIPTLVCEELSASGAPAKVASWIRSAPTWVEVRCSPVPDPLQETIDDSGLDDGEAAAIRLALSEPNSLLLIDEAAGRQVANRLGIANTGTLGVLLAASVGGLIDLPSSLSRLQDTHFRISKALMQAVLAHTEREWNKP